MYSRKPLFWLLGAVLATIPAAAQVTTGTLYGRVVDSSGGVIPGAKVTLSNESTGAEFASVADGAGEFTLTFLPVGRYAILIRKEGFKEHRRTGFEIAAGQRVRIDLALELGELNQTIAVTAEAPLMETASAQQQQTLTNQQVAELPLVRRDWSNLLALSTNANTGSISNAGGVVINGLAASGFALTVDGTSASGNPEMNSISAYQSPNYINVVSSEAIREVQFVQGMPSAEVADAISGNVNLITKSGTNELHGSFFYLLQNDGLNARFPFAATRQDVDYKQFGGSLGGPLLRNRLFYFFTFDGYRQDSQVLVTGNVPAAQLKADAVARNPVYKPFFDQFPDPTIYTAGATSGVYEQLAYEKRTDNHYVGRMDYASSRNMVSGRYTHGRPYREQPRILASNARTVNAETDQLTLTATRFQAGWTSESRFGWNRNPLLRLDNFWRLGIQRMRDLGFGLASLDAEYYGLLGGDWSFAETLALTRGRHSLKFGGRFARKWSGRDNRNIPEVTYSSVADLLNNVPASLTYPFDKEQFELRNWSFGGFLQDDFRMHPSLVLNLGLRYDFYSVIGERDGRLFNRGLFGPLRPPGRSYQPDYTDFSPRLGLAWTIDSKGNTVVRAGAGVFHAGPAFSTAQGVVRNGPNAPNVAQITKLQAQQGGLKYPITMDQALPYATSTEPGTNFTIDPNLRTAQSYQWLLTLQRALASNVVFETGYVGTRGLKLLNQRYLNQVDRVTGVRPVGNWQAIYYLDNTDRSTYHGWQNTLRTRLGSNIHFNTHYTWSKNLTYLLGDLVPTGGNRTPQNPDYAAGDKGPADTDSGHRFTTDFVYEFPLGRRAASKLARYAVRGWQVAGIFRAQSGGPLTATQGGTVVSQRPDFAGGNPYLDWKNLRSTRQYLNPAAFALVPISPASGGAIRPGNLGRNALRLPGWWNFDFNLAKNFHIKEGVRAQFRASLFNGLNHTTYSGVDMNLGTSSRRDQFGMFSSTRSPRVIQLEAKLNF